MASNACHGLLGCIRILVLEGLATGSLTGRDLQHVIVHIYSVLTQMLPQFDEDYVQISVSTVWSSTGVEADSR